MTDGDTTVLLGAGASVDAGLPTSIDLTKQISHRAKSPLLNMVIGSMISYHTRSGGDPFSAVNVERVFSALQMLERRAELEISPFVSSWTDQQEWKSGPLEDTWGQDLISLIVEGSTSTWGTYGHGRVINHKIEDAIAQFLPQPHVGSTHYRELSQQFLSHLTNLLQPKPTADLSYLSSLLSATRRHNALVATLNYDLCLEQAARSTDISIDTGVENWAGGLDWKWDDTDAQRLLKLHGSLTWRLVSPSLTAPDMPPADMRSKIVFDGKPINGRLFVTEPGLVFGSREKLRSSGPFLAMMYEFSRRLLATRHLCIIGYSFQDEHINALISQWLIATPRLKLTIVNPGFDIEKPGSLPDFVQFIGRKFVGSPAFPEAEHRVDGADIRVIPKGAREALPDVVARLTSSPR